MSVVTSSSRSPYYATIAAILFIAWLLRTTNRGKIEAPFYKGSLRKWIFDAETLVKDSYSQFKDTVYQIKATEGLQTMIPVKLIGEMKGLPDSILSQQEALAEVGTLRISCISRNMLTPVPRRCSHDTRNFHLATTATC